MYRPIKDYAIIGNLRSVALVSKDGSIDWAPAPFIGSPSIFCAILDTEKGGFWRIASCEESTVTQRYIERTNVVVTSYENEHGLMEVTDYIPYVPEASAEQKRQVIDAARDTSFKIHRRVACLRGTCSFEMVFCPRFDYARGETTLTEIPGGIHAGNKDLRGVLSTTCSFTVKENKGIAHETLSEGQTHYFVFRYNCDTPPADSGSEIEHHDRELAETISFWQAWTHEPHIKIEPIDSRWQEMIIRSALVLKTLFFEPVGTVAAAATTSLPEQIGGVRNWDYRFTWLRDSSFIFQSFFRLGHVAEARRYIEWLVRTCAHDLATDPDTVQIMYGLQGEREIGESFLTHLEGYRGTQPVRIGNDAYLQKQWDIYGSILDMLWRFSSLMGTDALPPESNDVIRRMADQVVRIWREPDEGLWEIRGGQSHFVYSKVMCWVALDRAIKLVRQSDVAADVALWEKEKEVIREAIFEKGWSEQHQSFVQSFGTTNVDAALLLLPVLGFIDGKDPRMLSTIDRITRELSLPDGLVYRYTSADGLPGREGAFLLASFWLVDALLCAGKLPEAEELFERVVGQANHVHLFSEEINPTTKEFLGNFPQAYTHVGLINSAFNLIEARLGTSR